MTLACAICPKSLEGTVYSFFMSAINLGVTIGSLNSSVLTSLLNITAYNFDNLDSLILYSNLFKVIPVLVILNIDSKYFHGEEK